MSGLVACAFVIIVKVKSMDALVIIGKRLRVMRTTRKESLRVVAKKTKISATTISRIERGKTDCQLYMLFRLCKHYRVHPKVMFQDLG